VSDAISGLGGMMAEGVAAVAIAGAADDRLRPAGVHQEGACHNCHAALSGPFCHACGQKAGHLHKPIWELAHDFLHSILHWDGRIWFTLRAMLFSPAKHVNDWINGRQMRYVPPIRLFVFISLLLIGLLTFSDVVLWQLKKNIISAADAATAYDAQEKNLRCLFASVGPNPPKDQPACASTSIGSDYTGQFLSLQTRDMGLKDDLIDVKDISIKGSADADKARGLLSHFNDMMKKPKEFNSAVSSSLSKYLLLAVPIHALLLKLFYIRRKRFLMEHVIFSLQSHTVLFFFLLIGVLVAWISRGKVNGDYIIVAMIVAHIVHLFVAMKRFYGQGIIRTFLKNQMISFFYVMFMTIAGTLVLVNAMGGLDDGKSRFHLGISSSETGPDDAKEVGSINVGD
jgi:hypothetical protein